MKGIAYGVGVGPGDPELMTLKAVRLIKENRVIAVPGKIAEESVAYKIAAAAAPEISDKELIAVDMPMTRDREILAAAHRKGAELIESYLDKGLNVVFLTLGDPTVYCTFSYLQHILEADGYKVELVSGIPSFCAAAARLGTSLTEWDEQLHILPALHSAEDVSQLSGNCVLMKSASHMKEVKDALARSGRGVQAVENCGMDSEKIYRSAEEIPDEAGYFTLVIAKEK
ncbi:MAG: precorrin-2 C(20)-methyltransferase [Firmicutes bacterium]|nr:precorrin-2 C(20)-methyltransferase [Bacillota bacterium]